MIHTENGALKMGGTASDLIEESVNIIHAVATAISKEIPEADYDEVVKKILAHLSTLKALEKLEDGTTQPSSSSDTEIEFLKEAQDLANKNKNNPDFFFIDEIRQDKFSKAAQSKRYALKDFIIDPRADEKDLK